jgi:hypothetical protein
MMNITIIDDSGSSIVDYNQKYAMPASGIVLYKVIDDMDFDIVQISEGDENYEKVEAAFPFTSCSGLYKTPDWAKSILYHNMNLESVSQIIKDFNRGIVDHDPYEQKIYWLLVDDILLKPMSDSERKILSVQNPVDLTIVYHPEELKDQFVLDKSSTIGVLKRLLLQKL